MEEEKTTGKEPGEEELRQRMHVPITAAVDREALPRGGEELPRAISSRCQRQRAERRTVDEEK